MSDKPLQRCIGRKELTARNRKFLELLADGIGAQAAYVEAGYKGAPHTAYELKRQLKAELRELLEARGYSMEGVASEILNLAKLKVDMSKHPNGIPLSQKIAILRLFAQTVKEASPKGPQQNVTAFIINRAGAPDVVAPAPHGTITDTTATDGSAQ